MNLLERAKEYFSSHLHVDVFHLTSDGLAFMQKSDAEYHSKTLKDQKIRTFDRVTIEEPSFLDGLSDAVKKLLAGKEAEQPMETESTSAPEASQEPTPVTASESTETITHDVTKEDITANPDLTDLGVKEGDPVGIPATNETAATAKKAPVKKAATTKAS